MTELISIKTIIITYSVFSLMFYFLQNHNNKLGGKISKAKALWLSLAIYIYFVLATSLSLNPDILIKQRFYLHIFLYWMVLRAFVEGLMLLRFKNWLPTYGIVHNSVSSALVLILLILNTTSHFSFLIMTYFLLVLLCLNLDSYYAWQFHKIAKGKTTGKTAIWFANDDEKYKDINQKTAIFNLALLVLLILFIKKFHVF